MSVNSTARPPAAAAVTEVHLLRALGCDRAQLLLTGARAGGVAQALGVGGDRWAVRQRSRPRSVKPGAAVKPKRARVSMVILVRVAAARMRGRADAGPPVTGDGVGQALGEVGGAAGGSGQLGRRAGGLELPDQVAHLRARGLRDRPGDTSCPARSRLSCTRPRAGCPSMPDRAQP